MPGIRPLLKLSFALQHALGCGAVGFHVANVALHAANAVLVYALFASRGRFAAGIAAIVFALEPVQTEAVTYVSGRSTSLAALFALGSLVAWERGRERDLSPLLFAIGLAVKEYVIVVPLAIALLEGTRGRRGFTRSLIPHLAVAFVAAVIAFASPSYRLLLTTSLGIRSTIENLAAQSAAIPYLLRQAVRPDLLNADPRLSTEGSWIAAALIVSLLVLGIVALRRRPAVALGVLWFFLWLAPTNSLLPRFDVVNDRQVYVALIGPAWLLGVGLARAVGAPRTRLAVAAILAIALGTATAWRNRVYLSETAFWADVVGKSPSNARAFNNLGYAQALAGDGVAAERSFQRALDLDPDFVRAAVNLKLLRAGALTDGSPHP